METNTIKVEYTTNNETSYETSYENRKSMKQAKQDINKAMKEDLIPNAIKIINDLELKESEINKNFLLMDKKGKKMFLANYKIKSDDKLAINVCRLLGYGLTINYKHSESKIENILKLYKRGMLTKSMIKSDNLDKALISCKDSWDKISKEDRKKFKTGDLTLDDIKENQKLFSNLK